MAEILQAYARRSSAVSKSQTFTVPAGSGIYTFGLLESPRHDDPSTVTISGLVEVEIPPTSVTEFYVDYTLSAVVLLKDSVAYEVTVEYYGLGTVARASWANQVSMWLERNFFILGQPEDASDPNDPPTGIIRFPVSWETSITIKRITAFAQTTFAKNGTTEIVVSDMSDWTDPAAQNITVSLTNTDAETDYWNSSAGEIVLDLSSGANLYIRATVIEGHANIVISALPA